MNYDQFTKEELILRIEQLEVEMIERKEILGAIFEKVLIGVALISGFGKFIAVNKSYARMFGFNSDEMVNLNVEVVSHPDDVNLHTPEVQKVWSGELDNYTFEKRYFRKNKSMFWGSLSISLVKSFSGASKYFIVILQDITEQKKA
jgi:diguanylate cyclase